MFIFYGKITSKSGHDAPPLTVIHKSIQQMIYRFVQVQPVYAFTEPYNLTLYRFDKDLMVNFKDLVEMVDEDNSLLTFLADEGKGAPTKKFLAAWENGFRAAALHRQSIFASTSIISKANWQNTDETWRHRSTYYVVSRKLLESPNLKNFKRFTIEDYHQRKKLFKTFQERHLPIILGKSNTIPTSHATYNNVPYVVLCTSYTTY